MPNSGSRKTKDQRPEWIRTPESDAIDGFRYAPDRRELEVTFKHGARYVYLNVPQHVFDELCAASSRGHFVAEVVKQYAFEKR